MSNNESAAANLDYVATTWERGRTLASWALKRDRSAANYVRESLHQWISMEREDFAFSAERPDDPTIEAQSRMSESEKAYVNILSDVERLEGKATRKFQRRVRVTGVSKAVRSRVVTYLVAMACSGMLSGEIAYLALWLLPSLLPDLLPITSLTKEFKSMLLLVTACLGGFAGLIVIWEIDRGRISAFSDRFNQLAQQVSDGLGKSATARWITIFAFSWFAVPASLLAWAGGAVFFIQADRSTPTLIWLAGCVTVAAIGHSVACFRVSESVDIRRGLIEGGDDSWEMVKRAVPRAIILLPASALAIYVGVQVSKAAAPAILEAVTRYAGRPILEHERWDIALSITATFGALLMVAVFFLYVTLHARGAPRGRSLAGFVERGADVASRGKAAVIGVWFAMWGSVLILWAGPYLIPTATGNTAHSFMLAVIGTAVGAYWLLARGLGPIVNALTWSKSNDSQPYGQARRSATEEQARRFAGGEGDQSERKFRD